MSKDWQFILIGLLLFIFDRATKIISLQLPTEGFFYKTNLIGIKLLLNKGIAFGVPIPATISITCALIIIFTFAYIVINKISINTLASKISLWLIVLGASSNLLDRIKYGAVVDFITIQFLPIFNMADLYIIVGVFMFIISLKRIKKSYLSQIV